MLPDAAPGRLVPNQPDQRVAEPHHPERKAS
jgi:hypothetical protein